MDFVPHNTNIDFIGKRYIAYAFTCLLIFATFFMFLTQGLNYGVDFKGGLVIEIRTPEPADLSTLRSDLHGIVHGEVTLQEFGSNRDILIRVERQPGGDEAQVKALDTIKSTLGTNVEYRRVETVGPKVSEDLVKNGFLAVIGSLIAMLLYVWFRFEWQFGVCAFLSLVHDAIAILGLYSIFRIEFNETAITAILITVTYSINDTVVVYDRIRENMRKFKKMPMAELINRSLNETLSRTILTVCTTLIALVALYFFGGPVIAAFSLPIIVGIVIGTFSSLFVSAPLLLMMHVRDISKKEVTATA